NGIAEQRGWARLATIQSYYSIAGRDLEREIVPMMADQKVGLMVWSPLAGGRTPRGVRLPAGEQGPRLGLHRGDARDRREAWCVGGTCCVGLCAGQALRDERDHRRQDHGAARRQSRGRQADAFGRRDETARRGERAAAGISRLDGQPPGRRARAAAEIGGRHRREAMRGFFRMFLLSIGVLSIALGIWWSPRAPGWRPSA